MVDHSNERTNTGFSIDSCSHDGNSRNLLDDELEWLAGVEYHSNDDHGVVRRNKCIVGRRRWLGRK